MPQVSIIIRTKNEARYLGQVLAMLKRQTFQDFEIIIVDDNSTDKTCAIARKYGGKIVNLPKGKFTYPYAGNLGASHSSGQYLVFLSGHSIPINKYWLAKGLANFQDKKVAGVFAKPLPFPDATWAEKLFSLPNRIFKRGRVVFGAGKKPRGGVLGFTNAIIRRDLWEEYPLNEDFAGGGEDVDWAWRWLDKGYRIVREPGFVVYHSHNLGLIDLIKQYIGWKKMAKPSKFTPQKRNF
ncbi:MAG: glycosyltransferase family A protein [Candidatus Shapirobacteria bacterium]|nr:glycosyltransferase family A protein [Candidatus Shapirobacteria bacterium]MDD5482020.1 glycosyltransferase family A protein [Candidatus Shapirobacteria bacterium]